MASRLPCSSPATSTRVGNHRDGLQQGGPGDDQDWLGADHGDGRVRGLLSGVLGTSAVAPPRSVQSTASAVAATPWTPHIVAANAALRSGDLTAASAASTEAYRAALASRRWEGLIEAADAHLRLAEAAGAPQAGVPRAR